LRGQPLAGLANAEKAAVALARRRSSRQVRPQRPHIRLTVSTFSLLIDADAGLEVEHCRVESDPRARDLTCQHRLQTRVPDRVRFAGSRPELLPTAQMRRNIDFTGTSSMLPIQKGSTEMFRVSNLKKIKSGAFKARKAIPTAVRAAYQKLYGQGWEAIFRAPPGTPSSVAKTQHAEWLALVERRIAGLLASATTAPRPAVMSQQVADILTGDWYRQFVAAREGEPGDSHGWDAAIIEAEAVLEGEQDLPAEVLRDAERFLTDRGLSLTGADRDKFLTALEREYHAAATTLQRRAVGDRGRDAHLETLAPPPPIQLASVGVRKTAGATGVAVAQTAALSLLEAYAADKGVSSATLRRWRPVMAELDTQEWHRQEWDAQVWIDSLVGKGRGKSTVKRTWLAACRTVMNWAKRRKRIASNPFADVEVSVPRQVVTRETGRGLSDWEAHTILQAAAGTVVKDQRLASRRWMPWLMAYTGARAGEVAQLRAGDVDLTRKALIITPSAGTVKTGKTRIVPIHEHLIEQGFLRYVQNVLAAKGPEGGLFYEGRNDAGKILRSDGAANKLSKWVRSLGISDPGISPNHAWRHTWKVRARRAGIDQGIRDAICGHSSRSVAQDYEHVNVEDMAEALKQFPRYTVAAPPHGGKN
jgi:integrase